MFDARVIYVDLPPHIKGILVKTFDEEECYNIVINSRLNDVQQREAYWHEMKHVEAKDFDTAIGTADRIEMIRHYG